MPITNDRQPCLSQCGSETAVMQHGAEMTFHFCRIVPHEEAAFGEQIFAVAPWRAYQRNPAGERFKNPNGRNAAESLRIRPARNVNGNPVTRENLRYRGG